MGSSAPAAAPQAAPAPALAQAQAANSTSSQARRIDVSAVPTAAAANDAGGTSTTRTTKVFATASGNGQVAPLSSGPSRAMGIGSRFKPAPPKALDRSVEKR
jgi:type IV secretion system protein VirB6